jgi:hypothetical protein
VSGGRATFRRLVVAFGVSRDGLAALGTWADLAARLQADLSGLFVEDADLMRMAALPFAQVIGIGSVARAVDAPTFARLMRRAAADARLALEAQAEPRALRCSFRTVRGGAAAALLENVERGDLVVLEHTAFGVAAWRALRDCHASVLYLRPEARHGRDVFVLEGDSAAGVRAVATQLAAASGRVLSVLRDDGPGRVGAGTPGAAPARPSGLLRGVRGAIVVASPEALAAELRGRALDPADPGCSILLVRDG